MPYHLNSAWENTSRSIRPGATLWIHAVQSCHICSQLLSPSCLHEVPLGLLAGNVMAGHGQTLLWCEATLVQVPDIT